MSLWGASRSTMHLPLGDPGSLGRPEWRTHSQHHRRREDVRPPDPWNGAGGGADALPRLMRPRNRSEDSASSSPQDSAAAAAASMAPVEGDHRVLSFDAGPKGAPAAGGHPGDMAHLCWRVRQEMGCCGTNDWAP